MGGRTQPALTREKNWKQEGKSTEKFLTRAGGPVDQNARSFLGHCCTPLFVYREHIALQYIYICILYIYVCVCVLVSTYSCKAALSVVQISINSLEQPPPAVYPFHGSSTRSERWALRRPRDKPQVIY